MRGQFGRKGPCTHGLSRLIEKDEYHGVWRCEWCGVTTTKQGSVYGFKDRKGQVRFQDVL